jgi:hypothetical protein
LGFLLTTLDSSSLIYYKLADAEEAGRFQEELELFDFTGDAIDMALR